MKFTPLRVALIYLGIAVIWILLSDYVAALLTDDASQLNQIQTYKGVFYVSITTIMLYIMMKSYESYIAYKEMEMETLIDDTTAGMAIVQNGIIESCNSAFNEIFRSRIREGKTDIVDLLYHDDKKRFLKILDKGETTETWEAAEFRFQPDKREVFWLDVKVSNVQLQGKNKKLLTVEDIRERKQFQIYSELLLELILSIEPAKNLKEALSKVVKNICDQIDWDFAEVWMVDENRGGKMNRFACWARDIPEIVEFDKECQNLTFSQDEGLPGLTREKKNPIWVSDITKHTSYARKEIVKNSGLKTVLSVPVMIHNEVFAVLMLYSILELKEDKSLVRLLNAACNDIALKLKQKKEEEQRIDAEQNLRLALEAADMATWMVDFETSLVRRSENFDKILGFRKKAEDDVESLSKHIHPEDRLKVDKEFEEAVSDNRDFNVEFRVIHPDKKIEWLWARGKPVNEGGTLKGLRGVTTVITERKKLEQKLSREREYLEKLFENLPVMITTFEPDLNVLHVNAEFEKITGFSNEDLRQGDVMKMVYPDEEKRERAAGFMKNPGKGWTDFTITTKSGENLKTTWTNIKLSDDTLIGIGIDIADRVEKEEQIRENEFVLNESQKVANIGSYYLDLETRDARTSEALDDIFGMPEGESMTLSKWEKMVHPDFRNVVKEFSNAMDAYTSFSGEYKIVRKDNRRECWVYEKSEIMYDSEGNPQAMIGVIQDITESKEQKEALIRHRNRLKQAQKIAGMGHFEYNLNTGELIWSDRIYELFGLDSDRFEVTPDNFIECVHPDDRLVLNKAFETIETTDSMDLNYRVIKPDGSIGYFQQKGEFVQNAEGEPVILSGTVLDVTTRVKYEEEITEMANIFQSANVGIVTGLAGERKFHRMNKAFAEMHGYTVEELEGAPIETVLADEYKDKIDGYIRSVNRKGHLVTEAMSQKKNGEKFSILLNIQGIKDNKGQVYQRVISVQDISEIKKIENKLKQEQLRFETAANIVSDVIWEWNPEKNQLWWNEGVESIFGYKRSGVIKDNKFWERHIHDDDRERVLESMKTAEESGAGGWSATYRFLDAYGNYRQVEDIASIIRNEDGSVKRIIGAMIDRTVEKEAERLLKESELQYKLLFEQNPIPMWIYDKKTYRFLEVNSAAVEKYGYSKEEFYTMTLFDIRPEEDIPTLKKNLLKSKDKTEKFEEWRHLTKEGKELIVEISASDITYKGKSERLILANDITRQRKSEENRLKALVEGEENERRRIAKELHDGLGQYLSAVNMSFESLAEDVEWQNKNEKEHFRHGLALLKQAMQETRAISQNLMPKAIEDYGLALAIESLVDDIRRNSNFGINYYQNIESLNIPYNVQINLYRIAQEAINNAIRHSNCKNLHVQLVHSNNDIILSIEDNGVGFDIEEKSGTGLGLNSMQTRTSAISGTIEIATAHGKGTMISIVVPVQ